MGLPIAPALGLRLLAASAGALSAAGRRGPGDCSIK